MDETRYTLWTDSPDSLGNRQVWDGDTGTGVPKLYKSLAELLNEFNEQELSWGYSLYLLPPQIQELEWSNEAKEWQTNGKVWYLRQVVQVPYIISPS